MWRRIAFVILTLVVLYPGVAVLRSEAAGRLPSQERTPLAAPQPERQASPAADSTRVAVNLAGILLAGFLIFFMQAGFALVETGMTRAKSVVHTMAMNVMAYSVGALGFWACGFALMFGGYGAAPQWGGTVSLSREWSLSLFGQEFGLCGYQGFFLDGLALDSGLLALFLFQMMFMDTAATIPTGAMVERWRFSSFLAFGFLMSAVLYPVYGNWVWGNGWLAQLGTAFGLGHGHVDFAGSSVVHMVGGFSALAGAFVLGPRIGKYRPDGRPIPLPAHNVPMYMAGTLILAFGWFGFNTGSCLGMGELNSARIAVNTILAPAAAAVTSLAYMWWVYRKPDPSFLCNGMLAGLVSVTGGCAFITPGAAVFIGACAGVLVVWSCLFVEKVLRVDDPVGAVSVHGVGGIWGVLAVGLFADGTYGHGWNHTYWYRLGSGELLQVAQRLTGEELPPGSVEIGVTGLLYGNPSQLLAQCVGLAANLLWVLPVSLLFFKLIGLLIGNRVSAQVELQGLDVPELGALGYITQDPKAPESRGVSMLPVEPRPARVPPALSKRFRLVVEGPDQEVLANTWSELCQTGEQLPPPEFRAVYPYMTTLQGNRFTFRGGDPETMRDNLERLLQARLPGRKVRVVLEF